MSAIDKMMKSIHENEKTFDDIPLAADVRTQSKVFDKEYYRQVRLKSNLFYLIACAIKRKEDLAYNRLMDPIRDYEVKFYFEEMIPVLQKKGYNIIVEQYLALDKTVMEYDFYIIWNSYNFYCNKITTRAEQKGHKITVFESKIK